MPLIEVIVLDRKDIPSAGAGETPIVGLAPAVGERDFQRDGRAAAFATAGAERNFIIVA
jgi:isoquinoline 1-oxidoreductase